MHARWALLVSLVPIAISCGRRPESIEGSPEKSTQSSSAASSDSSRAALKEIIQDPSKTPEEKRQAVIDHAKALGVELPGSFLAQSKTSSNIAISLPEGPPSQDPVESGRYVLSLSIDFIGGASVNKREACEVLRDGSKLEVRPDAGGSAPLIGELVDGRFSGSVREGGGTLKFEGQVAGKNNLAGRLEGGLDGGVRIKEGRWSLLRVQ
jgi:hypothetical protein